MGIQQHHPDPAAEPPTAAQAASPGLPGMMEQLTRALLHAPAEPTAAEPLAEAQADAVAVEADVPAEPPTAADEPTTVTPPAPRRPGAVLGELAFLDE